MLFATVTSLAACRAAAAPVEALVTKPGFHISIVSTRVPGARFIAVAPNGDILVSQTAVGRVVAIPRGVRADQAARIVVSGLSLPHGLAFRGDNLYVATWSGVVKLHYPPARDRLPQTLFADMPQGGDHNFRALALAKDGTIFVSSGSTCNVCIEPDPRFATILRYDADGRNGHVYGRGLRNASGLAFDERGRLWAVVNERDYLGDDVPPEALNLVREGQDYGWPYCHAARGREEPNPEFNDQGRCERATPPAFVYQAHSAPLGIVFYYGKQFPAKYRGAAFIAFHGSWNRTQPTGYKVVVVFFRSGAPERMEDFATGWLRPDGRTVAGRPVGLAVDGDGSLLVSDDFGVIYRVTYSK